MTELTALCEAGVPVISQPAYIGVVATFLSGPVKSLPTLPVVSRRRDIALFEIRDLVALSRRFKVNGTAADANAFAERLLRVRATSRSWNTVKGLVAKYSMPS